MEREKVSYEKFKELLYFVIAANSPDGVLETKLWKLLYFSEADFFEQKKQRITKVAYYKNHFGPTPDIKVIKEALSELKSYVKAEKIKLKDGRTITLFKTIKDMQYKYTSIPERETTQRTCEKYFHLGVNDICVLAHKDPPYLGANKHEEIDFKFVIYRAEESEEATLEEEIEEPASTENVSSEAARRILAYARRNS